MLEVKNIIEDIVMDYILKLDEVKNGEINKSEMIEIASYVLNRIHPMYITSNRGFTSIMNKFMNDPQFLADTLIKINEAMKIVKKARHAHIDTPALDLNSPYFVLPKIYGRVVSSKSLLPLTDAKITLYIDDTPASLLYSDWNNPLLIKKEDEGIFVFAPNPIAATPPFEARSFQITFQIKKGQEHFKKIISYETQPVFIQNLEIDFSENIMQVKDIYVPFE